ncbi:GAF domain-containing protein [Streptomyces sp. WAC01526]|uniref:GAF domain-containing protein n=1 Tax=Streptomyces sp. WAC01526 TaxID=2588709 RepID=UPI0021CCFF69|nr:GAF domain-containing protein [Streptomyces sp. WAC01526]
MACAGSHTYLAMPLIARGEVLGALGLTRARNPLPGRRHDPRGRPRRTAAGCGRGSGPGRRAPHRGRSAAS